MEKCPYASHCSALRIVDYQSHRRVRKPRLRTAAFNIPEKHCPLERQIYEMASDIFCTCFFNDSYIKSSGVFWNTFLLMCDVYPGNGGGRGRSWVQTRPTCSVISQLLITCSSPYPLSLVLDAKKGSPTASSDRYENPLWKCLQSFLRDQFQTWREK